MRRILAFVLLLFPLVASAQDDVRYGRLSDADKALTAVDSDPDAGAVVLWDEGEARIDLTLNNDLRLLVKRHRRVKVLRESGYALGEFSIWTGAGEQLVRVKGQTFVPQPNGRYDRVRLDDDDIVRQAVGDDVREARFSMPALAPGAIFEVEYETMSERFFGPPTWFFQSAEPTLVSRYRFRSPDMLQYVMALQGDRVEAAPVETRDDDIWVEHRYEWTARDVPALREEPFTTTEADYLQKLQIQLRQIRVPGEIPRDVLTTWDALATELAGHEAFGRRLGSRAVRDLAATTGGAPAPRAKALYDLVRTGFVWTGEPGFFADRNLDDVVRTRTGSTGELGLLLLALLRAADIPAQPVLLSTRSNGRMIKEYPIVSRFDHLLVLARPEGAGAALLDATDPNRPYGLLPVEALTGEGWVAEAGGAQWLSFSPPSSALTTVALQGTLAPDGTLDGQVRLRLDGYPALGLRTALAETAPADAVAAAADGSPAADVVLRDLQLSGIDDPYVPASVRAAFTARAAERVGDELYLTPLVAMRIEENPFQRATRDFPVDFAYPSTRGVTVQITLPDGYVPEAVPPSVVLALPSGAVRYQRDAVVDGSTLRVQTTLTTAAASVATEEYTALRALYDEIVASEGEAIVLVPAEAAAEDAPPAVEASAAEAEDGE